MANPLLIPQTTYRHFFQSIRGISRYKYNLFRVYLSMSYRVLSGYLQSTRQYWTHLVRIKSIELFFRKILNLPGSLCVGEHHGGSKCALTTTLSYLFLKKLSFSWASASHRCAMASANARVCGVMSKPLNDVPTQSRPVSLQKIVKTTLNNTKINAFW